MTRDLEFVQQRIEIGLAATAVRLHNLENRADIVFHIEPAKDRCFLRQIADAEPRALIHRKVSDLVSVEFDMAAISLDQPGNHVERRGLTGTVGSQ